MDTIHYAAVVMAKPLPEWCSAPTKVPVVPVIIVLPVDSDSPTRFENPRHGVALQVKILRRY